MHKRMVTGLFTVLVSLLLGCCFAMAQHSSAMLRTLADNPKVVRSQEVMADFRDGKETTSVIVVLRSEAADTKSVTDVKNGAADIAPDSSNSSLKAAPNLQSETGKEQARRNTAAAVTKVVKQLDISRVRVKRKFTYLRGFSADVTPEGLERLLNMPEVLSVEKNRILHAHLAQGIPLMNGTSARSSYGGSGISIAICDTGIDTSHPRLGGGGSPIFNSKVIGGYDTGDSDADPRPHSTLGSAHGTACAGIAAGDTGTVGDYIGGVAPDAKLYAIKISTGNTGDATVAAMIAGWEWAVTHQNDDPNNPILIISTSFGGDRFYSSCDSASPAMTTAAVNAVAAGITIFASSGNDGYCDSMGWPACISHVNSVGAVYDANFGTYFPCVSGASCASKTATGGCDTGFYATDNTSPDMVTSYSNSASFLDLFAPANRAYTADITGTGGYASGDYDASFGGTSAACPYAAGAAAVLQHAAKNKIGSYLTPAQVKDYLVNNGDTVTDGKVAVSKPRVNLGNAVADAISMCDLWNQPVSTVNSVAYANQDFETAYDNNDIFMADDFRNDDPWLINTIFIPGGIWNGGTTLANANTIHFQIYRDDSGKPDGDPKGGGNSPVWSLSVPPTDGRVTIATDIANGRSDVTLNLDKPVWLGPGTYWLVFYPQMDLGVGGQYGRQVSDTTNLGVAKAINPGGAFFPTLTTWDDAGPAYPFAQQDLAFCIGAGEVPFSWHMFLPAFTKGKNSVPPKPAKAYWGAGSSVCCPTSSTTFSLTSGGVTRQSYVVNCSTAGTWQGWVSTTTGGKSFSWALTSANCGSYKGNFNYTLVKDKAYLFQIEYKDPNLVIKVYIYNASSSAAADQNLVQSNGELAADTSKDDLQLLDTIVLDSTEGGDALSNCKAAD